MKKIYIDKNLITKAIKEQKTKQMLSKELSISIPTLNKICKEYKINYPIINWRKGKEILNERIRPDIDKEWIINNWVNTPKSLYQLAKENNISYSILDNRARKYNLSKRYKFKLNKEKLFNLKDPNVYYLAGLIATDGYLENNHNAITIDLTGEDELILLNNIKQYFEIQSNINFYNNSNRLRIACDDLKEFFINNFNIPNKDKTFNLQVPNNFYNEDCIKAYIRGCIDGDGSINKNNLQVSIFTASKSFILGLIKIIKEVLDLDITLTYIKGKKNKIPGFYITNNKCKKFLNWIYSLDNCFKLNRKYERYIKLMI